MQAWMVQYIMYLPKVRLGTVYTQDTYVGTNPPLKCLRYGLRHVPQVPSLRSAYQVPYVG